MQVVKISKMCYNVAGYIKFNYPPVAKLDIAADSDSEDRGFESLRADHYGVPYGT